MHRGTRVSGLGESWRGEVMCGLVRVSRLGGARCSLVGSCVVRSCKAWTSWRGSARCGAVMLGQL